MAPTRTESFASALIENIEQVIVGKRPQIELLLIALLTGGHALIEDVPGTGKTMLSRALAASLGLSFNRVQCTPDLMPNDITGVNVFSQKTETFEFRPGPVFNSILLVDEINRATPRTQSALLQAMQERQVTIDGVTYDLQDPFLVLATQNPIEFEGTFPLPEAQLDRFMMRFSMGYLGEYDEIAVLRNLRGTHPIEQLSQATDAAAELDAVRAAVQAVHIDETLERYIVGIVRATRQHGDLSLGASTRGALALYKTSQAFAALQGRDHVLPDDVKALVPVTLTHRLMLRPESRLKGRTTGEILQQIMDQVELDLGSEA